MNPLNLTPTQSFGIATKRFLETAENEQNSLKTHLAGRALLLGTALFGTAEVIARLALYCVGQIIALLTFYQSEPVNAFVQNQVKAGFAATVITSVSFFSLLSPSIFNTMQLSEEMLPVRRYQVMDQAAEERRREAEQVAGAVHLPIQQLPEEPLPVRPYQRIDQVAEEGRRAAELVTDVVRLPFQLMALTFQIPFYCIYLSFQLMLLPIRIALLPLQLMLCPFNLFAVRSTIRLNLGGI